MISKDYYPMPEARRFLLFIVLTFFMVSAASTICYGKTANMTVLVDATEMPSKLLKSSIILDLPDDITSLLYSKWIPRSHAPEGPIQNLPGLP